MTHSPSSAQSDLSDEQINELALLNLGYDRAIRPIDFARAIEREVRAAASAHTIGEDAADGVIGENCDTRIRKWRDAFDAMHRRAMAAEARAALTAEKVAGQEPVAIVRDNPDDIGTIIEATRPLEVGTQLYLAAPQQPSQPVAQTLALTDEQREAIEYAVRWMDENVSNRYAHTAAKELRALLAAQPASPLAEGGERE